jgi:hypothetical protein
MTAKTAQEFRQLETEKINLAQSKLKRGDNSLTRIANGFYFAATKNGLYEIFSTKNRFDEGVWCVDFIPTGDDYPSDKYEFPTLKKAREFIALGNDLAIAKKKLEVLQDTRDNIDDDINGMEYHIDELEMLVENALQ